MLLCVDIGNSHITAGLYRQQVLRHHWRLASDLRRTRDDYAFTLQGMMQQAGVPVTDVSGAVLASVVPDLTGAWTFVCRSILHRGPLLFTADLCRDIPIAYTPPQAVGADRLANVWAVRQQYDLPACVVDFGTATTFDIVDRDGVYRGGAIAPGLRLAADALWQQTAQLPAVELAPPPHVIGANTRHALQSGLFWGYTSLVEGMLRRFRAALGPDLNVLGTGGLAEMFWHHTSLFGHFAPWLTLEGLRLAYEASGPVAEEAPD